MKTGILLLVCLLPLTLWSQSGNCQVLLTSLQGEYEGECRNGVAHGTGKATGQDTYRGEFKKGLPHGKGKYTWANGDYYIGEWKNGGRHGKGLMVVAGEYEEEDNRRVAEWKNDKFVEYILEEKYKVVRQRNITRSVVKKLDEKKNRVEVFILNPVKVENLNVIVASGQLNRQSFNRMVIDDPIFPLNLLVEFNMYNKLTGEMFPCISQLVLESKGNWIVNLGQ